jgi:hypothetical protein
MQYLCYPSGIPEATQILSSSSKNLTIFFYFYSTTELKKTSPSLNPRTQKSEK